MDKEKLAKAITKALGYAENGGEPKEPKAGKTGEMKSIYQFTPDTWKLYAKQVLGDENVPLSNDAEAYVVHQKVSKWIDQGFTPEQIASMWNAGERKPNAYKENWKGVNAKYGVAYDTPAYAKKVADYTKQFLDEDTSSPMGDSDSQSQNQQPDIIGKMSELVNKVKSRAGSMTSPTQSMPSIGRQGGGAQNNGLLGSIIPQV